MSDVEATWSSLRAHLGEIETLASATALLHWDQQTQMPPKAGAFRGDQVALLSRIIHERRTDPRLGGWLESLEARSEDLDPTRQRALHLLRKSWDRATKLPVSLVEALARAEADGFEAWVAAKADDDFPRFAPTLDRILALTREKAAAIDAAAHPYDVLLDDFDPGTTVASLRPLFARLRGGLVELLGALRGAAPLAPLGEDFPVDRQRALHVEVAGALGYDFQGGRLDPSEHPFTIALGLGDVRITTRLFADDLLNGLGSTLHEAGHGMYEQGLPNDLFGTGLRDAASLGLHESQSRFWENFIGRSEAFCHWLNPRIRAHFPESRLSPADLYRAANRVEAGLIRVAADEVTYNLHIIVRFELELALLTGELKVADLPQAWRERYRDLLGVEVPDDRRGVLQDVHWSGGAFAYFPSYTLGNLYAASLGRALEAEVPDLWSRVAEGDFQVVLSWLRRNVHERARLAEAPEIVGAAVGERDPVADLLDHLWSRHGALHGVRRG